MKGYHITSINPVRPTEPSLPPPAIIARIEMNALYNKGMQWTQQSCATDAERYVALNFHDSS